MTSLSTTISCTQDSGQLINRNSSVSESVENRIPRYGKLRLMLLSLVIMAGIIGFTGFTTAQTVLNTTAVSGFSNNNGSGTVTFNFQNTNPYAVIITDVEGIVGTSGATTCDVYIKTTPVNGSPGAISAANGWTLVATGNFTGVANTANLTTQVMITGASITIPPGVTYGMAVTAYSGTSSRQRYHTMVSPNIPLTTVSGGGCNILLGTNISYGGGVPPTTPTNHPRGWLGKLTFVPAVACPTPPTPGSATVSPAQACPGSNIDLNLTGNSSGTGQSYQWQSAPSASGLWTDLGSSQPSPNLSTPFTGPQHYRCVVTCSGNSQTSASTSVAASPIVDCYCSSSATSTADEEIWNVTLGGLNNSSDCSTLAPGAGSVQNMYSNYKSLPPAVLVPGASHPMSLTLAYCGTGTFSNMAAVWIDFNQNGLLTDPGEQVYLKPFATFTHPSQVFNFNISIPAGAVPGNTLMRVVLVESSVINPCGTYTWGETEDYTVLIASVVPCTGSPNPGNTISSVSGPVCPSESFTLGLQNIASLGSGINYQWQSGNSSTGPWTNVSGATNPNLTTSTTSTKWYRCIVTCTNSSQSTPSNPVQVVSAGGPMSGTFTINSALATGGTNFQSFSAAVDALICRGVSGAVSFNVNSSSGPYNEQITIPEIVGASSANTITFNGNGRTLTFNATSSSSPHTLGLNGADFFRFNDLIVNGTGTTYALVCHLWNQADNNHFNNCTFNAPANGTSTTQVPFSISGSATSATSSGISGVNNIVDGCTMFSGYYNTCLVGNSSSPSTGNIVRNSTLTDYYFYGSYNLYQDGAVISNNIIERPTRTTLSTFYGVYLTTGCVGMLVEKNRIRNPFATAPTSTSTAYGVYCLIDGTPGNENRFYNNLISDFTGHGTHYGMYMTGADFWKAYHNTISFDNTAATSGTSYGIWSSGTTGGMDIRNNIISITRGGSSTQYGLYFSNTTSRISNNNDLFVSGSGTRYVGYLASPLTAATTLAAWQAANGNAWDQNSFSVNPQFTNPSAGNYTPLNGLLNSSGGVVGVTDDINGNPRTVSAPDIGAFVINVAGLDASILWISPTSPVALGTYPITVRIVNTASSTINTVTLNYNAGGPTLATQQFTGLGLAPGNFVNLTFATQYNVTGPVTLTANIVLVNGNTDLVAANNTASQSLCIGLSGNYTINSAVATGGTNYQSFTDAVAALSCGVAGPVVFDVAPGSGPYNEQVSIPQITGASAVNTITFNGNNRTLTFAATLSTAPHTLVLNGADWIRVNNLTIAGTGATFALSCHLWNNADNNMFTNCTFTAPANGTSTSMVPFSISGSATSGTASGLSGSNNIIDGCTIVSGYYNTCIVGNSASVNTGNVLKNCTLTDYYFYGAYIYYQNGVVVSNNIIERPTRTNSSTFYGVYLLTGNTNALIEKNKIRNPFGGMAPTVTSTAYGIYCSIDGTLGNENRFYNNLITDFTGNGTHYGMYMLGADYFKAYHNTIAFDNVAATSGTTYGIYSSGTVAGMDMRNNNITIRRGGSGIKYGLYFTSTVGRTSNNNNLFVNSAGTGAQYVGYLSSPLLAGTTLAVWQTANGGAWDQNSTSADPNYLDPSSGNYQPTSSVVNNTGQPLGITTDINNFPRSATTPDVGAIEFILSPIDIGPIAMVNPVQGQCNTTSQSVTVRLRNFGTQPLNFATTPATVTVQVSGTGIATLVGTIASGSLAVNATLDYTLPSTFNMNPLGSYDFDISAAVPGDGNTFNNTLGTITIVRQFSIGSVSSSNLTHCASAPAPTLTLGPSAGGNIQWQVSTAGAAGPWTNVGSGVNTYTPASLTQTSWFKVVYSCVAVTTESNIVNIVVNNPAITSSTPATRCGAGTVQLGATANSGFNINWYSTPGGSLLGSGNTFTTPIITSTTTYYAAASTGGGGTNTINLNPLVGGNGCGGGNMFNVTPVTNVDITGFNSNLGASAGTSVTVNIYYKLGTYVGSQLVAGDWTFHTASTVIAAGPNNATLVPITPLPLNAGQQYAIFFNADVDYTNITPPVFYTNSDMTVELGDGLCGLFSGNNVGRAFNGSILYTAGCVGSAVPITATVTPSTPISASATNLLVCAGNPTDLSVAPNGGGYNYTWTSDPAGFNASGSPVTANPTAPTTVYQVYGFNPSNQCGALSTVTVNSTPNNIALNVAATPASVCSGSNAQLQAIASLPGYSVGSNCGPGFIDISSTGTSVGVLGDDTEHNFTFPAPFTFNSISYNNARVGTNGVIAFGSTSGDVAITNAALPTTANTAGTAFLAPYWDDLDIQTGAQIRTQLVGNNFIIQFNNMAHNNFTTGSITFQVQLDMVTGEIRFIYPDVIFGSATYDAGLSATIGIQFSASSALQYSFNTASLVNNQCISYTPATSAFAYDWSANSTYLNSTTIANPVAQSVFTSEVYSVFVTDLNSGCTKTVNYSLNVLPVPVPSAFSNSPVCEGQDILLFAYDGISYSWSGPNGYTYGGTVGDAFLNGATPGNSGGYSVTVTGSNGCTAEETVFVQVNENPSAALITTTPVSCNGFSDGSFQVFSFTGTPFFQFTELNTFNTNFTGYFDFLTDGTYYVDVVDINGCQSLSPLPVTITTVPNVPPVISCPANISVNNNPGICGAVVTYATPVGTDVCPIIGTVQTAGLPSGSVFPIGTTVNTFRVTDVDGLFAECSFSVTVTDNEFPTITNVPANFAACNPISWTPPTITDNCPGVSIVSSHAPGSNFPFGTTTVTYTATDVYGHVSTASFNVTRYEESVAASSISSNRDYNNICLGENITMTVVGGSLGEAASWKWYTGSCGGTLVGTGPSLTASPTSTITYYVRAEGLCNTTACAQITVVVSTAPPSQAVVYNTVPSFGAPGITSTLSVNPVPGATYYRWFTNNGQINGVLFNGQISPVQTTVPTVDITFVLPQSNYQIRVMAGNACGRTQQSNTHIRGTVEAPTSLTGPTLVCPGQTHSYTVSAVSGTNTTYNWQLIPSSAGTISGTGLTRQVTFAAGFTSAQLCVNGISNFGLPGAPICIVISTNAPTPGAVSGLSTPCQGSTHTYSIAAVAGATSYNWSSNIPGVSIVNNGTSASVTFPASAFSGNICVTANSACGVSAASCKAVTSGAPGVPGPISGPVQGICGASNVNYSLSTSNANSYQWVVPAGVTISGAGNMNSVNLNFGAGFTNGTIQVIAYYDCGSASSTLSVNGAPNAPIITPATICAGTTELYFASSTGASSYNWSVSGALYNQCTNPPICSQQYIEWGAGGGSFSVTASNTCGTSAPFNLSTNCRVSDSGELDTKVYPNPTTGQVTVEFTSYAGGTHQLTVTDLSGRVILVEEMKAVSGLNRHDMDLGFANKGLYMLYVKDQNGKISVTKVAVE
jgi:hypothetical protein